MTDALARAQRLVILGEPGAGKSISLRFIALLAAYGYGMGRLGLSTPLLPIKEPPPKVRFKWPRSLCFP